MKGAPNWELLSVLFGVGIDEHQYDSNEARLKAAVEGFLLGNGHYQPTWRALMYCLDGAWEVSLADKIRRFGEPVQGECTCSNSSTCTLESWGVFIQRNRMMEWNGGMEWNGITMPTKCSHHP